MERASSELNGLRAFGPFRFDPATGEICRGDTVLRLPNQPARMLEMLTSRPGELVSRDELRRILWASDTFVDFDACLNYCARRIRGALGDTAESPTYLETVPRRGYRFIAAVSVESPTTEVSGSVPRKRVQPDRGGTMAGPCRRGGPRPHGRGRSLARHGGPLDPSGAWSSAGSLLKALRRRLFALRHAELIENSPRTHRGFTRFQRLQPSFVVDQPRRMTHESTD